MKTRYFSLTLEALDTLRPCPEGREFAEQFLPAVLSTNPEENITLVEAMFDRSQNDGFQVGMWVSWLCGHWASTKTVNATRLYDANMLNSMDYSDLYVAAQALAWIADWQTR